MGVINFFSTLMTCKVLDTTQPGQKRELPQWSKGNFQYNWIGILIIGVPIMMVILGALLGVPLTGSTFFMALVWSTITGIGVTGGYHRYFSHRCFNPTPFMQKLFALGGAGAFQGSIKWWARLHRIHHKYTDTDKDPYNAKRGLFFSHCGWFMMRMDYDLLGEVDMSDLDANPIVKFQRDNFAALAIVSGVLLPWMSCILVSGDVWGGFFYGVFFKAFLVHQCSFAINSLAHTNWFGATQDYNDEITPHDSIVCALVTFGEGYHNFHHEFPNDYRNGFKWYHFDPTKWYVNLCSRIGMCDGLVRTPDAAITRSLLKMDLKRAKGEAAALTRRLQECEPQVQEVWSEEHVQTLVKQHGRKLIIVDGYVLDVLKPIPLRHAAKAGDVDVVWYDAHPGGRAFLDAYIGRDATEAMSGGVYKHAHGAHCIMPELRVAHLKRDA